MTPRPAHWVSVPFLRSAQLQRSERLPLVPMTPCWRKRLSLMHHHHHHHHNKYRFLKRRLLLQAMWMWTRLASLAHFSAFLTFRFWLAGTPSTLTAVVSAAPETNRPPFGARRSRKLARLRAENLPLQRFESNMPPLPAAEELEIAIQEPPRPGRLPKPNLQTSPAPH